MSNARWRKSSRSGGGNNDNCVEVAVAETVVAVRDSKNTAGPVLAFPRTAWSEFVAGVSR
jgi:hypothetical protein